MGYKAIDLGGEVAFDTGVERERYGPTFKAKYDTVCPKCGEIISIGDDAVMMNLSGSRDDDNYSKRAVHEGCKDLEYERGTPEAKPGYRVKGKRKPKMCNQCYMEHNGECL